MDINDYLFIWYNPVVLQKQHRHYTQCGLHSTTHLNVMRGGHHTSSGSSYIILEK